MRFVIQGSILFAALIVGSAAVCSAASTPPLSGPLVNALKHGECGAAVKLINPLVSSNDAQTSFIAGRMLMEGLCLKRDEATAADFLAHAAALGNRSAQLDYAAMIGLGVGAEQSYTRAGDICRTAGLDSGAQVSSYALGYACTLGSVASRLVREAVPKAAFRSGADPAMVEFNAADANLTISSTPPVRVGDPPTGSYMRAPVIDAKSEINRAWRDALAQVPKPDAAKLSAQAIALPLDVDVTLEIGRAASGSNQFEALRPSMQPMVSH